MRSTAYRAGLTATLAVTTLIACDSGGSSGPGSGPRFYRADAILNPNNVISARVTVTARGYDSAFVRFWNAGGQPERTPSYGFGPDTVIEVPVLGLDVTTDYSVETDLVAGADTLAADTAHVTTGSLPAWIPQPGVAGTDTTPGYLLLSFADGPAIIDNTGKIRWYLHSPGGILNSFQAGANGQYTSLGVTDSSGFLVFNVLGDQIGTLSCQNGFSTRFHDVLVERDGGAWILCNEDRVMDLSGQGGVAGAVVTGNVIQHLSPTGQVLFEWNTFDHFQITDLPLADRTGPSVNFVHGNGIALDYDGNLLVSWRSLNEITKIDVTNGQVMWRMGGLANQFTFINDSKGLFERQHGLRVAVPGEFQVLDNGQGAPSRLVRYLVNPVALEVTQIMQYIDSPTLWAPVGGSTQYYSNGHAVVTFGQRGRVAEVDPAGNKAWELTGIDNVYVFRVQRIHSLYFPAVGDPIR